MVCVGRSDTGNHFGIGASEDKSIRLLAKVPGKVLFVSLGAKFFIGLGQVNLEEQLGALRKNLLLNLVDLVRREPVEAAIVKDQHGARQLCCGFRTR